MRVFLTFIYTLCLLSSLIAQDGNRERGTFLSANYGVQAPVASMADYFGTNFTVGTQVNFMTKNKLLIGVNAFFLFSDNIKIDMLQNLRTNEGEIIGQNREYSVITQDQRGYYVGLQIGKILPVLQVNQNSGVRVTFSAGVMEHKIRIDDKTGDAPQLAGEYTKGYDRLTNGVAVSSFVGYHYMSNQNPINFYIGLEYTHGFTKNRRSYDFLTMQTLSDNRNDGLLGLRAGWIIPIYKADNPGEIFY